MMGSGWFDIETPPSRLQQRRIPNPTRVRQHSGERAPTSVTTLQPARPSRGHQRQPPVRQQTAAKPYDTAQHIHSDSSVCATILLHLARDSGPHKDLQPLHRACHPYRSPHSLETLSGYPGGTTEVRAARQMPVAVFVLAIVRLL